MTGHPYPVVAARSGVWAIAIALWVTPLSIAAQSSPSGSDPFATLAERAQPGILGAVLMDARSGVLLASANPDRPMPMQSVVKAPLGAAVLAQVDAGNLDLDQPMVIERGDLSAPRSPINDAWPARNTYTVRELLEASVGHSDNTAADVLLKLIGGPAAATRWLREHGLDGIRIDRYEREFQTASIGLTAFRPEWASEAAYSAAVGAVPERDRLAATRAYLADPRDTATPRAAATFLGMLSRGELLSRESTLLLLDIMTRTPTGTRRLKAGLPESARLAHKTGTGRTVSGVNQATNDIGIVTLPDGRSFVVAVFLAGSTLQESAREDIVADAARVARQLDDARKPPSR